MELKHKILIVDDEPMFRELESLFLARTGRVITAEDGDEGFEIAQREQPDVILTDLSMPGMRGDELCRRVKADPRLGRTPVIIVTGSSAGEEHERAVRAGAADVIEKPVNRISLIQAVNHVLRLAECGLERVSLETDVRLDLCEQESWAWALNVSRGGIFLELDGPGREPDTELQLEFTLPETQSALAPTAKVVWRRRASGSTPEGVGLQFLKLDRDSARQLGDFVYEHASTEAPRTQPAPAPLQGA